MAACVRACVRPCKSIGRTDPHMLARLRRRMQGLAPNPPPNTSHLTTRLLECHQGLCSNPSLSAATRGAVLSLLRHCAGSARATSGVDELLGSTVSSFLSKVWVCGLLCAKCARAKRACAAVSAAGGARGRRGGTSAGTL